MPGGSGQKTHRTRQIASKSTDISADGSLSELNRVQIAVVELYGRGLKKREVVNTLLDHLSPPTDPPQSDIVRRRRARVKLRKWEKQQIFRDALFNGAIIATDLAAPDILKGVVGRAKEGNVDAAKFALEVAGRYTPRGDPTPPVVTVNFGFLPRPDHRADAALEVEADELDE